ncbi:hypothetical protein JMJ35_003325 [Cladonia borealis]|uniref:Uncharacterized protein n=1 Tax=Cladonia borealis TaxID=184061 RepID=A0AA39V3J1_9LECA|nr:hypothetical protein JMJ35_003325 [Cladonia borealis]
MTTQPLSEKLTVFILNLDKGKMYENLFDSIYSDLIASLLAKYHVQRARSLSGAQRHLNEHQPIAILLPDPAVTLKQNSALLGQVINYVQAGGFAIFSCNFSSFINESTMDRFWKKSWSLDWKFGDYHRTDVYLNRSITQLPMSSLPNGYSQKAVFLKNVANDDSVYRPSSDSVTQSLVFPSVPANPNEAAVALTKVGEGWLGYIGDVNNEQGSQAVILSMLELAAKHSASK